MLSSFKGKTIVVKYGGNAMKSEELKAAVMDDIAGLYKAGIKVVLVHGGGPDINNLMDRLGKVPEFIDGLRVTDEETVEIVVMALAGKVNKSLVNLINLRGVPAAGISGIDGGLIRAEIKNEMLGFVGSVTEIKPRLIYDLLEKGYVPVISTIGFDDKGNILNINGDTAASYVAGAIKADRLIMLTDVPGVLMDKDDPSTLIKTLSLSKARELTKAGIIEGGMIPKCECCELAIRAGVKEAVICDGSVPHAVTAQLTGEKNGTLFTG